MSKSDKELAAEIVIAMINANQRAIRDNGTPVNGLSLGEVQNALQAVHKTLQSLPDCSK